MLRNSLTDDEDEEGEEGEEREGDRGSLDHEVSSSLDLLSKAMELLQQAEEYANTLMQATMVPLPFSFLNMLFSYPKYLLVWRI